MNYITRKIIYVYEIGILRKDLDIFQNRIRRRTRCFYLNKFEDIVATFEFVRIVPREKKRIIKSFIEIIEK